MTLIVRGVRRTVLAAATLLAVVGLICPSAALASASSGRHVECIQSSSDQNQCGHGVCERAATAQDAWVCICDHGWANDFSRGQYKPCSTCDIRAGYKTTSSGDCVLRDRTALKRIKTQERSGNRLRELEVAYDATRKAKFGPKGRNTRSTEDVIDVLVLSDHPEISLKACPLPSSSVATLIIRDPSISINEGDFINGAVERGCIDENHVLSAFLWKVEKIVSVRRRSGADSATEIEFEFSRRDITDLFEELYIKIDDVAPHDSDLAAGLPEQHFSLRPYWEPETSSSNSGDSTTKRSTESYVRILGPIANSAYFTGDSLVVEWDSGYGSDSYDVIIYSDNSGPDSQMASQVISARVGVQRAVFSVGNWAEYDFYYVYISYPSGCTFCTLTVSSDYFWVNYKGKAAVSAPGQGSLFKIGDSIPWTISLPSQYISSSVYVYLRRSDPLQLDPTLSSRTYSTLASQEFSGSAFVIDSTFSQSSYYYIQVSFNCWTSYYCDYATSKYFSITTGMPPGPELAILTPKPGALYYTGQAINIAYNAANAINNVRMSLFAERSLGPDSYYAGVQVAQLSPGNTSVSLTIRAGLPALSTYYVIFEWNCVSVISDYFSYCRNARTRPFSINFYPPVTVSSPAFETTYKPGEILPIRWNSGGLPTGTTLYIGIYEQIPFNPFDKALLSPGTQANDGVFDFVIPQLPNGAIFNYYIELRWNCVFLSYVCSSVRSQAFRIDSPVTAGVNYNAANGSATGPIDIFHTNCSTQFGSNPNCDLSTPLVRPLCNFCDVGGAMIFDVTCTSCWAQAQVATTYFEFEYSFGGIKLLDVRANGLWRVNVDVELTASLEYENAWETTINPQPIPIFGKGFRILGFDFSLGLTGDLIRTSSVSLDANGRMAVGADSQILFSLTMQYGYLWSDIVADLTATPSLQFHPPTLELNAQLDVTVGLRPVLKFSVGSLFSVSAGIEPYILAQAGVSVPAFPASPSAGLLTFGVCNSNHYARLDASFGMKLTAQCNVLSYSKNFTFTPFNPVLLARLCLFREFSPPEDLCVSLATLPSTIGVTASSFATLLLSDITESLPSTYPNLKGRFQRFAITVEGASTRVCMTILGTESSSAASLASDLQALINNPQSSIYDRASRSISYYAMASFSPQSSPTLAGTPRSAPTSAAGNTPIASPAIGAPTRSPANGAPIVSPATAAPIASPVTAAPSESSVSDSTSVRPLRFFPVATLLVALVLSL